MGGVKLTPRAPGNKSLVNQQEIVLYPLNIVLYRQEIVLYPTKRCTVLKKMFRTDKNYTVLTKNVVFR